MRKFMNLDEILHHLNEVFLHNDIRFRDGVKTKDEPFEYYYCEECLYLVRHKKAKSVMMFIDAYSPDEAIQEAMEIMKEVENEQTGIS